MCGFSLFYSSKVCDQEKKLLISLNNIAHRGPDASGHKVISLEKDFMVGLAHARLSIIDISKRSNQPMKSFCGKYIIVFNGEIYNYLELKKQINTENLRTNSDTEIFLEFFAKYGTITFSKIRGIFAAAILDIENNQVFIARDQLGVKPLYYFSDSNGFYFSSEIKGLLPFYNQKLEISKPYDFCYFLYLMEQYLDHSKSIAQK